MPTATINFSDELYFKLGSVVKQTGMSRSAFVNKALENYLQELQEDSEDYERAEKAWNDMTVILTPDAKKDLKKLDKSIQKKVSAYLDEVAEIKNPRSRGKALIGNLMGMWRYRVGDYRILCKIKDEELIILVLEVGHRKNIYDK